MKVTALITGGADRIGRAIALRCAEMGYDIALHYSRSGAKAEETAAEIRAKGAACRLYRADFSNFAEAVALVDEVSRAGRLGVLVNNASLFFETTLADGSYEDFELLFNVNFKAPYALTKEFARRVESGVVINLLDTEIVRSRTKYFDYLLTKKLLAELTRMAALYLAPGIRVNGVAPGLILPPAGHGPEFLLQRAEDIPLKRPGSAEKIAHAVQFLLESDFVTGQVLFVDGGEAL